MLCYTITIQYRTEVIFMEELISKKELLTATGISYGQLYRWKREKLIPDSWFIKRSSFTGQETFLPRGRAMERIRFIMENKDRYSLLQLLDRLSPDAASGTFSAGRLAELPRGRVPAELIAKDAGCDELNYGQALCVVIASQALGEIPEMDEGSVAAFLGALAEWQASVRILDKNDGRVVIVEWDGRFLPLYMAPDSRAVPAAGARVRFEISLADIPARCAPILEKVSKGAERNG
jgi:hypothetical protein